MGGPSKGTLKTPQTSPICGIEDLKGLLTGPSSCRET